MLRFSMCSLFGAAWAELVALSKLWRVDEVRHF